VTVQIDISDAVTVLGYIVFLCLLTHQPSSSNLLYQILQLIISIITEHIMDILSFSVDISVRKWAVIRFSISI
jgi:hypothetical protein